MSIFRFALVRAAAFSAMGLCLLALTSREATALAGELDTPGVATPSGLPDAVRQQIQKVLKREDCQFLDGFFVNWFTTLRYSGETQAFNLFLDDLAKCPGVTVSVKIDNIDCDWRIHHDGQSNRFTVVLNIDSPKIELTKVHFPETHGPPLPKEADDTPSSGN
ncbi:MAG: hypothetical protein KDA80_19020 [Planctomycetaceae bacterium]|nr:hypothetical protein [Planctomycetaceae bacterium]